MNGQVKNLTLANLRKKTGHEAESQKKVFAHLTQYLQPMQEVFLSN